MGMIPELPVAMLACTRIGAPFTVVFGGFSAESLSGRMNDMQCELLITQDEGWRRGNRVPLKANADAALEASPTVTRCVVVRRTGGDVHMLQGRDVWANDVLQAVSDDPETCACEPMDSEDLLYLLYTSGTTAKPKGIIHTTAGYLVGVASTHHYIFDVKPSSIYWCAADIGWVTGHSYIVFGPLANATTGIIYEGTPDFPDKDRWWKIVERYKPDILYTAPTTIRTHMTWGHEDAKRYDLSPRRRTSRRGRGLLAAGARRRRDERLRASHLNDRGRERARQPPRRGRGCRRRSQRRADRPGHRRLRHFEGRQGRLVKDAQGAARPRRQGHRQVRGARQHRVHA